ncbi:MAG: tetratricopeptide (TPR) repeat protein [Paraglaciecola sp.]|jgi:tetratricopeptide (TPR) repeat protein
MTQFSPQFVQQMNDVYRFQSRGNLAQAAERLNIMLKSDEGHEYILRALVQINIAQGKIEQAAACLESLIKMTPGAIYYSAQLANFYDSRGHKENAITSLQRYIKRNSGDPYGYFQLAVLFHRHGMYQEALTQFNLSLSKQLTDRHDAYLHMANIYQKLRNEIRAIEILETGLRENPKCIPLLFNLAGLNEELGEKTPALALYHRILAIEPNHFGALTRIAYAVKWNDPDSSIVQDIARNISKTTTSKFDKEGLNYSLGKIFDDCQQYDKAFGHYKAANIMGKSRIPKYDRKQQQNLTSDIVSVCNSTWMTETKSNNDISPIFVCGMFRSGSTLVEQILSGHSALAAAGETNLINKSIQQHFSPFPQSLLSNPSEVFDSATQQYMSYIAKAFPGKLRFIDKQPDNFLYIGLIKKMFPRAKIICTDRNPLDISLSVYFQQLSEALPYATELVDIGHYYKEFKKLAGHWQEVLGHNDFLLFDYDKLVDSPESMTRSLLDFCELEWDANCLEFYKQPNAIKTASIWQVRQALYSSSSGRWKNYQGFLPELQQLLGKDR